MTTVAILNGKKFDFASKLGKLYTASIECGGYNNWAGVEQNINAGDLLLLYKAGIEPEDEHYRLSTPVFVLRFITPTGKVARLWISTISIFDRFDDLLTPEDRMELRGR